MSRSPLQHPAQIRLCYLLPLLSGLLLLALAAIPHFYFTTDTSALDTMSLFGLLDNTYQTCIGFFNGEANGNVSSLYFSYVMMTFWVLSWLCIALYGLFAVSTALISMAAWTPYAVPTHFGNNCKRLYRLLVPNEGMFVFFSLLPLLPSVFPWLLQIFYRNMLELPATLHYFGLPDVVYALLLSAACIALLFLTAAARREKLRMDIFRLYKLP